MSEHANNCLYSQAYGTKCTCGLGDGEPSSAKEFMETIVAGIKDRVHRACHFCGEIRPDPQPTDYSSVCNSPKNDMLPDTAGSKHHAYQRWPNKNSIMEVRASAEWKQFGCEPKPRIEGVAEWRWRYYATHPAGVDDETYECLMLQAYAAQFTGTNFLEFRSGAAQEVSPIHPVITVSHGAPPGIGLGPSASGTTSDPRTGYLKQQEVSPPSPEPEFIDFCESPCGHSSRYAFTENGGKNIECLLCNREAEGDTRELKAALLHTVGIIQSAHYHGFNGCAKCIEAKKLLR